MKRFGILILSFAWITAMCVAAPPSRPPDIAETGKDCEFRVWYLEKGTRSEGIHGALSVSGKWLSGKKEGEIIKCALGEFVWHGDWESRKHEWAKSGWLPKDLKKIDPSWKKEPNQSPEPTPGLRPGAAHL